MRKLLRRPSPAMVVACLALAVALGGTGYAAISIPRNSVGSAQLKKNAVISSKVKNRSLKAVDFAYGQLPRGPKGATGATGASGATHVVIRSATGAAGAVFSHAQANCAAGEVATGGTSDYDGVATTGTPVVDYGYPVPYSPGSVPTGWVGGIMNTAGSGTVTALAWVICASP